MSDELTLAERRDWQAIEFARRQRDRAIALWHEAGADVKVENHGTIVLLRLNTQAAHDWALDNIDGEAHRFGGAVVVEPRYVAAIVDGMRADGLGVA